MPDVIRINDTIYSWTSTSFKIDGQPWTDIVGLTHEQKRERKIVYAARKDGLSRGRTSGKYSVAPLSLKMLTDSADALTTYLSIKGAGSYGDARFSMLIQIAEPVPGALPITIFAEGCSIDGEKDSHEEGIEETVTEFEVGCLRLTKNKKRLWSLVRGLGGGLL